MIFQQPKRHHQLPSLNKRSLISLLMGGTFLGTSIAQIPRVNAQSIVPGIVIENQATGSFVNPTNSQQVNIESNVVQVTIAELAGITLTPAGVQEAVAGITDAGPNQGNGNFEAEDIVYFLFTATNVGNDPTQFFIPGSPSSITNGSQAGQIEVIGLDSDGPSGSTAPQDFSNIPVTIRPEGNNTGDATALGVPVGAIPENGTITLRVPIKIDAGLSSGDVSVVLGNTSPNDNSAATQNQDFSASGSNLDVYTQDNEDSDGITGEGVGNPINGDSSFNRKEASANNSLTIGGAPTETHTLSGYVFVDGDGDNTRGGSETVLSNINVRLFDDINNDGQLTAADDSDGDGDIDIDDAIAITSTDINGFYQFEKLDGNYLVVVDQGDADLTGYTYGGTTSNPNDVLNEERNADISGADIITGLDFPFDIVLPGPPIIDLDGDDSSGVSGYDFQNIFTAGGPSILAADNDVTITDNENTISSATITLTNRPDGTNESLSITSITGVTASAYDSASGTITLTGDATLSTYQSVIASLTYANSTAIPSTDNRIITVQVTDNNGFDSNIAQSTITIRELSNIIANPDLEKSCSSSLKMILILDSSGSVNTTEANQTRTGILAFLNRINSITSGQVELAIVEFATTAAVGLDYTPINSSTITNDFTPYLNTDYYNDGIGTSIGAGGVTNWDAAFQVSFEQLDQSDAVLFTTDGNPNTILLDDGTASFIGNDAASNQVAIDNTVPWSNQIKFEGSHIFGVGITDDAGDVNVNNFFDLTDGDTSSELFLSDGSNALTADYLEIDNYATLGTEISNFVESVIGECSSTSPNMLLVKRITSINNNADNGGVDLASYDPDNTYPYDDNTIESGLDPEDTDKWPNTSGDSSSTFLIGARDGGVTEPGDEIEYTIYFLSAGTEDAQNVEFCDRLPDGQTFIADSFTNDSSTTQDIDGIIGEDLGIMVSYNGNNTSYTNIGGDDAARFYPPGSGLPPSCNILLTQSQHNGAVVINLGDIPKAESSGDPVDSYGFVRFRATVD